jgi:diguanylate cyclase (GGDEF)-like protein
MDGKREQELLGELKLLRQRIAELEADRARGRRLDDIIGVLSPRAFRARLAEEVERARRHHRALSLAVVSVDGGRAQSARLDARPEPHVIAAQRLVQGARAYDVVGRVGPEEFGLLLPETGSEAAIGALERLLDTLEHAVIGVASPAAEMSAEGLMATARMACEQARDAGGRRITLAASRVPEAGPARRDYRPMQFWGSPAVHIR